MKVENITFLINCDGKSISLAVILLLLLLLLLMLLLRSLTDTKSLLCHFVCVCLCVYVVVLHTTDICRNMWRKLISMCICTVRNKKNESFSKSRLTTVHFISIFLYFFGFEYLCIRFSFFAMNFSTLNNVKPRGLSILRGATVFFLYIRWERVTARKNENRAFQVY